MRSTTQRSGESIDSAARFVGRGKPDTARVQVNVGEGSGIDVMGRHFDLVQMHFHRPSEERVNGKTYDMVAHLVHKDAEGQLAVVAVLLEKGSEHPLIQTLWNNLPLEVGQELTPSVPIDLNRLLPEVRSYWTYMGSLTTPPCSEGVLWMVMKQPQQISPDQEQPAGQGYALNGGAACGLPPCF